MSSRAGRPARRRRRHARHVLQLRLGAVDRRLLLADDRRSGLDAADDADLGPGRPGRARQTSPQQVGNLPPVGSLFAAFLGFNPLAELLGPTGVLNQLPTAQRRQPDRQAVLPAPDLRPVPPRAGRRLRRRGDHDADRRGRLADPDEASGRRAGRPGRRGQRRAVRDRHRRDVGRRHGPAIDAVDAEAADVVAAETIAADKAR